MAHTVTRGDASGTRLEGHAIQRVFRWISTTLLERRRRSITSRKEEVEYSDRVGDRDAPVVVRVRRCGAGRRGFSCEEEPVTLSADVSQALMVVLDPADVTSGPGTGLRTLDGARLTEGGLACTADGTVSWIGGIAAGEEVRVLEFRTPFSLVVDVR